MTTVNVDSSCSRREREGLLAIAQEIDSRLSRRGRRCLIRGGHGAVSVPEDGKLQVCGEILRYNPRAE